ncbi:proline-rich protein 23A3-like [Phodopus roborovskii]|uniref:7420426K07Rik protein n=1 Tax=Phodopus roborovskii TaxID=109678 RepID=A0AAU9ZUV4_PHORO|nr:proline-rich protein 23A3-like [Phodopus roborovskii]CAH6876231.1 7420426K07Rik [Phodopus roborovskii]
MRGARPRSPGDYLLQDGLNPAKRPCLREPGSPERLAQPDVEAPSGPAWEEPNSNSVVVVPTGCALKLHLEAIDLLLEPNPTSISQVSLSGCTITLVPEDLLEPAQPGQLWVFPCSPQEAAVLDIPPECLVLLQHGSASAPGSHIQGAGNFSQPGEVSQEDSMMLWVHAPSDTDPGLFDPFTVMLSPLLDSQVPWPWTPSPPPSAGRDDPWCNWTLSESMLEPLPSSPLQPLPPSPATSPQGQCPLSHQKPPRSPCKARKRLF